MDSDIPLAPNPSPARGKPASRRRIYIPHLFSWIAGLLTVLVLIGLMIPTFGGCGRVGVQTRDLANAKTVGLALKIFAGDHEGLYPNQLVPTKRETAPDNSNLAFACLFPKYIRSEDAFGNAKSAYQTRKPDNVIDDPYTGGPGRTLEPGENTFGYVMGLSDDDNPTFPLVVDGTDGTGHYVTDPKKRGGVWKGQSAIVIRLDNSGTIEKLAGPDNARYLPRAANDPTHNLLDMNVLNEKFRLLDPAVAAGHP